MKRLFNQPSLTLWLLGLFLLLSQGAGAQYNVLFLYQTNTGGYGEEATSKTVGLIESRNTDWPRAYFDGFLTSVTYTSSDPTIATIGDNENNPYAVTAKAPGTVTIKAHYTGTDYALGDGTYTLTITDDRAEMSDAVFGFSSATASATYGGTLENAPTLNTPSTHHLDNVEMSSSNTNVATVTFDNKTFAYSVTIVGAGSADISAVFAGDSNTKPKTVKYTLTVNPKEAGLTWASTEFTYDGSSHVPTATATGLVGSDACTVTVDGAQTNAGSYTATASALSNTNYKLPAANTTTFTIAKATATVSFASPSATAKMGESFTGQTATTNPAGLALTYSSTATDVATVDASTGAVKLVGAGETKITAKLADTNNYNAAEASYTLTVTKQDVNLKDPEISFSKASASGQYGDASIEFPKFNNPHSLSPITWNSSDDKVAKVDNSGQVTVVGGGETKISASFGGNTEYASSTVYYKLTIAKLSLIAYFEETKYIVNMGKKYHSPKIKVEDKPADLEMGFVYTSENEDIAKVNAKTGDITPVGKGRCLITATYNGSSIYDKIEIQYLLIVLAEDENNPQVLEPIEEEKDLSFSAAMFINADGAEKDMSNAVIDNRAIVTLKEDDYFDEETNSLVLNTVTEDGVVDDLLDQGVVPGEEAWAKAVTAIVVKLPDEEEDGELLITSQEADGVSLMVKVGQEEPIPFSTPEMTQKRVPVLRFHNHGEVEFDGTYIRSYAYLWDGGRTSDGFTRGDTRGKKTAADIRVRNVSYRSSSGDGIQQVTILQIEDDKWFDLGGRRIAKPTKKGIYIHGRKKVVIR